jgi:hypothetical protein
MMGASIFQGGNTGKKNDDDSYGCTRKKSSPGTLYTGQHESIDGHIWSGRERPPARAVSQFPFVQPKSIDVTRKFVFIFQWEK